MSASAAYADTALIGQRRARSLAGARRRTQVVRVARIALLAAMAALAINAAVQVMLTGGDAPEQPMIELTGGERIVNPRLSGRDQGGRPFIVTAASAARRASGLGAVADLESPSLDYALVDAAAEQASRVLARSGVFDEAEQSLLLREDVRLSTQSGYTFETQSALIRLNEGRVSGEEGVYGEAPWGAVRAGRFEVHDDGRRILLENGVRTRLYMDETADEAASGE